MTKIGINEPNYQFISSQDTGNHTSSYVKAQHNINNIKLSVLEFKDSDSLEDKYLQRIKNKFSNNDYEVYYLNVHEAENYLINSSVISRALKRKNVVMGAKKVEKYLTDIMNRQINRDQILDSLSGSLDEQFKQIFNDIKDVEEGFEYRDIAAKVRERVADIRDNNYKYPFLLLPGKEILKIFKNNIKTDYNIAISETDIAQEFSQREVPKEIKNTIEMWKNKKHANRVVVRGEGAVPLNPEHKVIPQLETKEQKGVQL